MLQPALDGDRVVALAHRGGRAPTTRTLYMRHTSSSITVGAGNATPPALAEHLHQRRVLELAHDVRTNVLGVEPLVERAPQRRVARRQEQRRILERRGETGVAAGRRAAAAAKNVVPDSPSRWLKTLTRRCGGAGASEITASSACTASWAMSGSALSSRQTTCTGSAPAHGRLEQPVDDQLRARRSRSRP